MAEPASTATPAASTPTDELLELATVLGDLKERFERVESELSTQAKPLEASALALKAALDGLAALKNHLLENSLHALGEKLESQRRAIDEQITAIVAELRQADAAHGSALAAADRTSAALGRDVEGLRTQLSGFSTQIFAQLERIALEQRQEITRLATRPAQPGKEAASFNPRGAYRPEETYGRLDIVSHLGASYVSHEDGNREKPSARAKRWTQLSGRPAGNSGGTLSVPSALVGVNTITAEGSASLALTGAGITLTPTSSPTYASANSIFFQSAANSAASGTRALRILFPTAHRSGAPFIISSDTTTFGGPATENDAIFLWGFNAIGGGNRLVDTGGSTGARKFYFQMEHDYYQTPGGTASRMDEWHLNAERDDGTSDRLFQVSYFPATGATSSAFTGNFEVFAAGSLSTGAKSGVYSDHVHANSYYSLRNAADDADVTVLQRDSSNRLLLAPNNLGIRLGQNPLWLSGNMTVASARPSVGATVLKGEIHGYSETGDTADDGFLRLSAGGGTTAAAKTSLDIAGFYSDSNLSKTIVATVDGSERWRVNSSGTRVTGDSTVTGTITTGALAFSSGSQILTTTASNSGLTLAIKPSAAGQATQITLYNSSNGGNANTGSFYMGGGGLRDVTIESSNTSGTASDVVIKVDTQGEVMRFNSSGTGIDAAKNINLTSTTAGFLAGTELSSSPSAPAANGWRLYAKDNGSGKTQLIVRFATGAEQVIATEP